MHGKANNSRSHKNISKDSRFLHNCLFCLVTYYNWCDWFLPSLILWRKTWQVRQLVTPPPVTYEPQPPSKRKTSQRDRALAEGHWLLPEMSHFLLGGLYTNKEIFLWTAYHKNVTFTQDLCTSSWIKCLKCFWTSAFCSCYCRSSETHEGRMNLAHFLFQTYWVLQFSNHSVHKAQWEKHEIRPKLLVPSGFNSCRHAFMFLDHHHLQRWTRFRSIHVATVRTLTKITTSTFTWHSKNEIQITETRKIKMRKWKKRKVQH